LFKNCFLVGRQLTVVVGQDKSMMDSLDRSSGDMFDSTNSPITPRAKGATTSSNTAVITIAPPPLKVQRTGAVTIRPDV
jgi:hypothetical protein